MNADGLMCTRIGLTLFIKNLLKRVKKKKLSYIRKTRNPITGHKLQQS